MRIALLSDIHGNLEALDACLRHARERDVQHFAFLGDFVGYGADPAAVVATVAEYAARGSIVLKGNHDAAVERHEGYFNEAALAALEWAKRQLDAEQKRFLAALPLTARDDAVCYVHASASYPDRWEYIDSPSAAYRSVQASERTYTFCGHVHDQVLYFERAPGRMGEFRPNPATPIPVRGWRRWLAVVGSVGQPRDRNPAAAYTIFDATRQQITFHRVAYDAKAAADRIRQCGLPSSLAYRVELGI